MIIGVLREVTAGENRVAATPETARKFIKLGFEVLLESGAGLAASYHDSAYAEVGVQLEPDAQGVASKADILLKIQAPTLAELPGIKTGALVLAAFAPHANANLGAYAEHGLTCIALELIPRITRAQSSDILSSQANVAGYKAVLMAANEYQRMFPMLMTAAGTIKPARVVVLGVGVAGLQAIATAKRLGAVVEASDLRPVAREQVQSLGGKWLDVPMSKEESAKATGTGGYAWQPSAEYMQAQGVIVDKAVAAADIVITTALIPGRKAPVLVKAATLAKMKPGSVLVDMAVASGGNVEGSEPGHTVVTANGVKIIGEANIPALVATETSALFARNIYNLLEPMCSSGNGTLELNSEDVVVKPTIIVAGGEVLFGAPAKTGN